VKHSDKLLHFPEPPETNKSRERDEIADDVAKFLAQGGKIEQVDTIVREEKKFTRQELIDHTKEQSWQRNKDKE
jgi:hypothetical protein